MGDRIDAPHREIGDLPVTWDHGPESSSEVEGADGGTVLELQHASAPRGV